MRIIVNSVVVILMTVVMLKLAHIHLGRPLAKAVSDALERHHDSVNKKVGGF